GDDAVDEVYAQGVGDETGTESFYAVWTWAATGQYGTGGRFDGDNFQGGFSSTYTFGDSGEGSTGADANDDHVNAARGIIPYFYGRTFAVSTWIGLVVELLWVPAIGAGG